MRKRTLIILISMLFLVSCSRHTIELSDDDIFGNIEIVEKDGQKLVINNSKTEGIEDIEYKITEEENIIIEAFINKNLKIGEIKIPANKTKEELREEKLFLEFYAYNNGKNGLNYSNIEVIEFSEFSALEDVYRYELKGNVSGVFKSYRTHEIDGFISTENQEHYMSVLVNEDGSIYYHQHHKKEFPFMHIVTTEYPEFTYENFIASADSTYMYIFGVSR